MAGGFLRSFGGIFLTLGIAFMVLGLGVAAYGFFDDRAHRDESGPLGAGYGGDRYETNQWLMRGGLMGAGAGLLLTVIGIVGLSSGSARARVQMATARPTRDADHPSSSRKRQTAAILVVLVLVAGVVAFVLLRSTGDSRDEPGLTEEQLSGSVPLATGDVAGRAPSGVTVTGGTQGLGDSETTPPFELPAAAVRIEANVTWQAGSVCCATLQVYVEQEQAGTWTRIADATGSSGMRLSTPIDPTLGPVRFSGFPAADGLSNGQDFVVTYSIWAT